MKKQTIRDVSKYLLIILVLSVVLPAIMPTGTIVSDQPIEDRQVLHRDGLFGPTTERIVFEDGTIAHTTTAPWYYFPEQRFTGAMNIYGIEGSSISNEIYLTAEVGDDPIPITFKQQNDLDFTDSDWGWWPTDIFDSKEPCVKSQLVMYPGIKGYGDDSFNKFEDEYHDKEIKEGYWYYGDTWTSTLNFYPVTTRSSPYDNYMRIPGPGSYSYTVEETLYPEGSMGNGYDMDKAWVHATVQKSQTEAESDGTGQITVKVLDNLYATDVWVNVYQDGTMVQESEFVDGERTFDNLEFGEYRFEVRNDDYDRFFTEAFPYYDLDKSDRGIAELTSDHNSITYVIYGDFEDTDGSAFDPGDDTLPEIGDGDNEDDDRNGGSLLDLIVKILDSFGLFHIVALGIPLFLVAMVGILLILYNPGIMAVLSQLEAKRK
jgi:hypothetical protein